MKQNDSNGGPRFVDVWTHVNPDQKGFTFNALEPNLTKRVSLLTIVSRSFVCSNMFCNNVGLVPC